ncbi:MAG: hypothetical protein PHI66_02655 [Candidatus Pacebacteria bacterium]|nr:hypothetical protein [Candidatus Paceibacterota bacterium]
MNKKIVVLAVSILALLSFFVLWKVSDLGQTIGNDDALGGIDTKNYYGLGDLVGDGENVSMDTISPDGRYAFGTVDLDSPTEYEFYSEDEDKVLLYSNEKLVFATLGTGEKLDFELYDMASDQMIGYVEGIPEYSQYYFLASWLGWSDDSRYFWGVINLFSAADPPVVSLASIFKFDTENLSYERYAFPAGTVAYEFNMEKERALLEIINNDKLYLSVYDIHSDLEHVVISYDIDFEYYEYTYPDFFEVDITRLDSKWMDDNHISYMDIVTGEIVEKEIKD